MEFCPACRNMLYPIDEETTDGVKRALFGCRRCDYKKPITRDNPVVYDHSLREDKTLRLIMNKDMKNDPTLDHLTNIVCPNQKCPSRNGTATPDVVPVEINDKYLIWMYQCVNCETTWKQSASAK